jgi:transketolase
MIIKEKGYSIDLDSYKGLVDREIIGKLLLDVAEQNQDVILAGADAVGSCGGNAFREKFPQRTFDFGIAEPNLISASAGFAKQGKIAICGIFGFLVTRTAEQIKLDVCYNHNPVKIFSSASGFDMCAGGFTHHAIEDISILRNFPEMTIIQPASPLETIIACFKAFLIHDGAVYLRLTRTMRDEIYQEKELDFKIGQAVTLRPGKDITLIATGGRPVKAALQAADLLSSEGISARVLNMHTIKPIDEAAILKAAQETKGFVTVEEANISGGLGSAVSDIVSDKNPKLVKKIGIPNDRFSVIGHSADELCQYFGISSSNIVKKAKEILN